MWIRKIGNDDILYKPKGGVNGELNARVEEMQDQLKQKYPSEAKNVQIVDLRNTNRSYTEAIVYQTIVWSAILRGQTAPDDASGRAFCRDATARRELRASRQRAARRGARRR